MSLRDRQSVRASLRCQQRLVPLLWLCMVYDALPPPPTPTPLLPSPIPSPAAFPSPPQPSPTLMQGSFEGYIVEPGLSTPGSIGEFSSSAINF